jgi:hypothetical protein
MIFSIDTKIRSTCCLTSLQTIADLDQVAVRVLEVNGQEPACGTLPLIWTGEDLDPKSAQRLRDFLYWVVRQETEVPTPWDGLASNLGDRRGILEADLV